MNIPTECVPIGLVDSEKKIKNRQHPFCLLYVFLISNNKNIYFLEDYSLNIPTKFGFNWPDGFREEDYNVQVYGRRQRVMTISHLGSGGLKKKGQSEHCIK